MIRSVGCERPVAGRRHLCTPERLLLIWMYIHFPYRRAAHFTESEDQPGSPMPLHSLRSAPLRLGRSCDCYGVVSVQFHLRRRICGSRVTRSGQLTCSLMCLSMDSPSLVGDLDSSLLGAGHHHSRNMLLVCSEPARRDPNSGSSSIRDSCRWILSLLACTPHPSSGIYRNAHDCLRDCHHPLDRVSY